MSDKTGRPAFPRAMVVDPSVAKIVADVPGGMTLWEYFAGQALVGLAGSDVVWKAMASMGIDHVKEADEGVAMVAGCMADAMLLECEARRAKAGE